MESVYKVFVLHEGYSKPGEDGTHANCSCTLIKGKKNIIVDTMTPWDGDFIIKSLSSHGLKPDDIDFVISTHGHSDHCGNNNLFLNAIHVMGFTVSQGNKFFDHKFEEGLSYRIDDFVEIIPTPGHMLAHVSVLVKTYDGKNVVVAGDLFENEYDIQDCKIWKEAGSEDEAKQTASRQRVLEIADWIIPGHGKMFDPKLNRNLKSLVYYFRFLPLPFPNIFINWYYSWGLIISVRCLNVTNYVALKYFFSLLMVVFLNQT